MKPFNSPSGDFGLSISDLNFKYQQKQVLKGLNWAIRSGEQWVLTGASGSGKSTLAKIIAGSTKGFDGHIELNFKAHTPAKATALYVESWYQFKNLEGVANFYYQQRYTSLQAKDTLTVNAELGAFGRLHNLSVLALDELLSQLGFSELKDSQLIELSSGEHKKLQLVKALWLKPQLLIIDQPYTGLDAASRKNLNQLLDEVTQAGVHLILITNDDELPTCINKIAKLHDGVMEELSSFESSSALPKHYQKTIPSFLQQPPSYTSDLIARMENVSVSYGDKEVLKNINWEVRAGEKWLLKGPNGSGKSTLLSLINGDHPQSYANTLYLFGQKRGSGESIWDIKEHIGLISPEFHWYFDANATVWESIASGLYDSVGLFKQLPYSKSIQVDELVAYFDLSDDKNEFLHTLPLGKQRLVLLARTIIKNPELLILDEPCQGLDQQQTNYFNALVDELCGNGMTLIYVGHQESALPNCLEQKIELENGSVKIIESIKNKDRLSTLVE
ncbi:MAG: ATP-binding cassette domain-containing protein [Sphingobacteriales bacterium]|nr:ATP-binding cassette domain-containing protein [Sphingobacteriales bacterium]